MEKQREKEAEVGQSQVSGLTAVWRPTVFDLSDVSHHDLGHGDLDDLAFTDDGELLLLLDATLQPAELLLLGPVVEGRDQNHNDDGEQNGGAFDPAGLGLALVLHAAASLAACCKETDTG